MMRRMLCRQTLSSGFRLNRAAAPVFFQASQVGRKYNTATQSDNKSHPKAFSGEQVDEIILRGDIVGWVYEYIDRDIIRKQYQFKNFDIAWDFMNRVANVAREMNHHPEWFNVYNRVNIVLTTHDANGVSQIDIDMAKKIDDIANELHAAPSHEAKRVGAMTSGESKIYPAKDENPCI